MCETTKEYILLYILICHMARPNKDTVQPPEIKSSSWLPRFFNIPDLFFTATGGASSSIISSLSTTPTSQPGSAAGFHHGGNPRHAMAAPQWQFWCGWEASSNSSTCACTLALRFCGQMSNGKSLAKWE